MSNPTPSPEPSVDVDDQDIKPSPMNNSRKVNKGSGGRKIHSEYSRLAFDSYRLENYKLGAKCKICGTVLKNTSVNRLRMHRRCCSIEEGRTHKQSQSQPLQKPTRSRISNIKTEATPDIDHTYNDDSDPFKEQTSMVVCVPTALPSETGHVETKSYATTSMQQFGGPYHSEIEHDPKASNSCDWHDALGDFLFGCNVPFDVVESEHFRNFIETMRPVSGSQLPDRKAVASDLLDSAYERSVLQRAAVASSTKVAKPTVLVVDSWTEKVNEQEHRSIVCTLQSGLCRSGIEFLDAWQTTSTHFRPDMLKDALKKVSKHPNGSSVYATLAGNSADVSELGKHTQQLWHFTCARAAAEQLLSECIQTDLVNRVALVLNAFRAYAKDLRSLGGSGLTTVECTRPQTLPAALDSLLTNIDALQNLATAKNLTDDRVLLSLKSMQFVECVRECRVFVHGLQDVCALDGGASLAESVRLWLTLKPPTLVDRQLCVAYQQCVRQMLSVHAITAYYLHPQMNRDLLSAEQLDTVQEWLLVQLNSSGLDDLYAFQIGTGLFELLNAKLLKQPIVYWSMASRKHPQLAELAIKLLQVPAVVGGRYGGASSYVHSRARNGLDANQWKRLLYVYYDRRSSDGNAGGDY